MPYQRPIFATLALVYCVCIGAFALIQNPRASLNRNFAFYNFANALYNSADWAIFFSNHTLGVWWVRLAGVGGSLMMPFLMLFVFELTGVSQQRRFQLIGRYALTAAIILVLLHTTPLIIRDANYVYHGNSLYVEVPGKFYPLFAGTLFLGLATTIWSLVTIYRTVPPLQREKFNYVLAACSTGALALGTYFLSFFGHDLPVIYYSLQALVAFIFSYAIFKHNLISVGVAFRRSLLIMGIYVLIGISTAPFFIVMRHTIISSGSWSALLVLVLISGLLFSFGPLAYGWMVRRSALFQDTAASHITHEFKTPLHAIQNAKEILAGELAKQNPDTEKIATYMDMIDRNTNRLQKFVTEILTTFKAESGSVSLNKEELDVVSVAKDALSQFPALHTRIRITSPLTVPARADREALFQIFTNLISNAAKHAPESEILLSIDSREDGVHVFVADQGRGIKSEDLKKIFEPFAQSKGNVVRGGGTGLGLAITKKWVEAHGGRIWAESDGVGRGAKFVFILPI